MDETPRERLAREMDNRRKKLRLRWTQVAVRAGMSVQTLLRIRSGETAVTDFAAEGIEQALEWPSGHVVGILADRDPKPIHMDEPLTAEQQMARRFYESWKRDHGHEEALLRLRMLRRELEIIDAEEERRQNAG